MIFAKWPAAACAAAAVAMALVGTARAGDFVLGWNAAAREAITVTDPISNPGAATRELAMLNLAIYDAVMGVTGTHVMYPMAPAAPAGASAEAAAAAAAYGVLSDLYPWQQASFDALYAQQLAAIADGPGKAAGVMWGQSVAAEMHSWRADDHADDPQMYAPSGIPGRYAVDPILQQEHGITQDVWGPQWGDVTPFAIPSRDDFQAPPPPAFDSQEFADAYYETMSLGAENSVTRTAEQTEIANFWAYDRAGTGPPPIMFNQAAEQIAVQQGNDWLANVRLFAAVSTAMADAGICSWDAKYTYDLGRPVTVIREADLLGAPLLTADEDWRPLGAPGGNGPNFTPPFPTYVSGHATFGGALFEILALFYGTDEVSFVLSSDELPGVERWFDSFSEAMAENGRSRVYLGIHWSFDDLEGQDLGMRIADYIWANNFQEVPEPATLSMLAAGLGLLAMRRRPAGS